MLIAKIQGKKDLVDAKDFFQKPKNLSFSCPVCNESVILKIGPIKERHFAHTTSEHAVPCTMRSKTSDYHGIGAWHRTMQAAWPEFMREQIFLAGKRRADVRIPLTDGKYMNVEFQSSALSTNIFIDRCKADASLHQKTVWLFNLENANCYALANYIESGMRLEIDINGENKNGRQMLAYALHHNNGPILIVCNPFTIMETKEIYRPDLGERVSVWDKDSFAGYQGKTILLLESMSNSGKHLTGQVIAAHLTSDEHVASVFKDYVSEHASEWAGADVYHGQRLDLYMYLTSREEYEALVNKYGEKNIIVQSGDKEDRLFFRWPLPDGKVGGHGVNHINRTMTKKMWAERGIPLYDSKPRYQIEYEKSKIKKTQG